MARKLSAYNIYMRKALKGKMKGKTKAQRKAIFRAAAKGWKGKKRGSSRTTSSTSRSSSRSSSKQKSTGGRKMGSKGFLNTSTIMKFFRIGALAAPAVAEIVTKGLSNEAKMRHIVRNYTGFDYVTKTWNWQNLLAGWMPFISATAVTYGVQKLAGMIRRL